MILHIGQRIEERSAVVTLSNEGYLLSNFQEVEVSLCAVQNILKKKEETGTVADRLRCGRPWSTTEGGDRNLIRLSLV